MRIRNRRYIARKRFRFSSPAEKRRIKLQIRKMRINKIKVRPPRPTYGGRR
jgi:hypothetical protein